MSRTAMQYQPGGREGARHGPHSALILSPSRLLRQVLTIFHRFGIDGGSPGECGHRLCRHPAARCIYCAAGHTRHDSTTQEQAAQPAQTCGLEEPQGVPRAHGGLRLRASPHSSALFWLPASGSPLAYKTYCLGDVVALWAIGRGGGWKRCGTGGDRRPHCHCQWSQSQGCSS